MHAKELNAEDLVLWMGKYSLLVVIVSLFHKSVCSKFYYTKLT